MLYTDEGGGRSGSPEPNEIIFFGDKCYEGGNDYSVAQKADIFWQVKNWKHTHKILAKEY